MLAGETKAEGTDAPVTVITTSSDWGVAGDAKSMRPKYCPGGKAPGLAVTVTSAGVEADAGVKESQFPPVMVDAVAVKDREAAPKFETDTN